jgi:antitoxin component of RelBE/YafQ-DinJ toxin-antitoxin module
MPNQPATPTHSVRVDQSLWDEASKRAAGDGQTIADVIRKALERYARQ